MIRAGAFDSIESNRAALIESLSTALDAADQAERSANQVSLLGDDSGDVVAMELSRTPAWDLKTKLSEEKLALGFFFSGHLFDIWKDEVRTLVPRSISRLEPSRDKQWVAGVISTIQTRITKTGKKMLNITLDDGNAQQEITIYSELFEEHKHRLKEDQLLIAQVKVSQDEEGKLRIGVDSIYDLQLAREARARVLRIRLNGNADATKLKSLLDPHRATQGNAGTGTPVEIVYETSQALCTLRLGESWRVRLPDSLVEQLTTWTSPKDVQVTY